MPFANRPGLVEKDQERGLEGIVPIGILAQEALAHGSHHGPVAVDQGGKGRFILVDGKALQEMLIAGFRARRSASDQPDVPDDSMQGWAGHGSGSRRGPLNT
jgi:hypothetical protein